MKGARATKPNLLLLLLPLLLVVMTAVDPARAQTTNSCQGPDTCCFTIDFERLPGTAGARLQEGYDEVAGPRSEWSVAQGVRFALDSQYIDPNTQEPYPIALLNASASTIRARTWQGLYSPSEGLVATAARFVSGTFVEPLQNGYAMHVYFDRTPACVTQVRALRTVSYQTRTSASVELFSASSSGGYTSVERRSHSWSAQLTTNVVEDSFSRSGISRITLGFSGFGYGALSSISACFPGKGVDRCGVCGGSSACYAPQAGDACRPTNRSTSPFGPACTNGTMTQQGDQIVCVANPRPDIRETCNGLDDDCNGLVDDNLPPVSCGVGLCWRRLDSCVNGQPRECKPGDPGVEICNGLDDDCDGLVDEDGVCDPRTTTAAATTSSTSVTTGTSSTTATSSTRGSTATTSSSVATTSSSSSSTTTTTATSSTSTTTGSPLPPPPEPEQMVVPSANCRRRMTASGPTCQFYFDAQNLDADNAYSFLANQSSVSAPLTSPEPIRFLSEVPLAYQPGVSLWRALAIEAPCASNLTWHLGRLEAFFSPAWTGASCDPLLLASVMGSAPPTPMVEGGCVQRLNASHCRIRFGYYNPNAVAMQVLSEASPRELALVAPAYLIQGRVRDAVRMDVDCASLSSGRVRYWWRVASFDTEGASAFSQLAEVPLDRFCP